MKYLVPCILQKRTNRILGANEEIQGRFDIDEKVDYETELAVIIGKEGKGITEERAEEICIWIFRI